MVYGIPLELTRFSASSFRRRLGDCPDLIDANDGYVDQVFDSLLKSLVEKMTRPVNFGFSREE